MNGQPFDNLRANSWILLTPFKSGQLYSSQVACYKGRYKNPLTDAKVEDKFCSLGHRTFGRRCIGPLLECLWRLNEAQELSKLLRRLTRVE